jgi:hypothetical protein
MANQRLQPTTILWYEFMDKFMPKLNRLATPAERLVCARLMKATIEDYIEKNS